MPKLAINMPTAPQNKSELQIVSIRPAQLTSRLNKLRVLRPKQFPKRNRRSRPKNTPL